MGKDSVIIIGAGLAGLSAGCYAQMNGYQSRILEHDSQAGGVAAAWQRRDYLIDGGIHFVMGHRSGTALYEMYEQLGIVPETRFSDLTTYGRFIDEPSGTSLLVTQDMDRLARDLKVLAPTDAGVIDDLVAGVRAFQGLDMSEMGLDKPPELAGPLDQVRDMWGLRGILRYLLGRYGRSVADYARDVDNPVLRRFLENLFLPEVPAYFVLMILALLADGQMGLIDGGCHDFVGALERHYLDLGGVITYRSTVAEILVESDRAVGVRLARSAEPPKEHRAAAVISAADGYSTIFGMLGGRYVNKKIENRYETWPRFRPLLMISYGVEREFRGEPPFSSITLHQPLSIGTRPIAGLMLRIFNYSSRSAPPGKTVIQAEFETDWDYWYDLQRENRNQYEAEKERVAGEVLQRLGHYYPGLASQVEVTDVSTPYTTWRYTLNDRGAWEGWLMTPKAIRTAVERTLPGLKDFYMAGQWVMPGGGVSPCLYSGRHAIQLLCNRDGKQFSVSTGLKVPASSRDRSKGS